MPFRTEDLGSGMVRQSVRGKVIAKRTTKKKAKKQIAAIEANKHGRSAK